METCIYKGFVTHRRFKPLRHYFSYKTFSILFDLTELEDLHKKIGIFSFNRFNIFSFYNKDHGSRDGNDLTEWVKINLKKYNLNFNVSKIKLLCFPRVFGYVFNPLSIFYCYDGNVLKAILYEVKNTFNEQHTYVFPVNNSSKIITQQCNKKFYVSPFIKMDTFYNFRLTEPDESIRILIKQTDKDRKNFSSLPGRKEANYVFKTAINKFLHTSYDDF